MAEDLANYPNPLDEFRTYSYHFILTVTSSTEALRKQIEGEQGKQLYSLVNGARLMDRIPLTGTDDAYLVIDTRRFSQFSITNFETEQIFGSGDSNNPTMPITLASMRVLDTTGLNFFNYMIELMQVKVRSTRASAFYLLNIIFVGHRTDNTTQVISTCYIPLMLITMSAEFDHRGSVYEIEFVELEGGPQRNSKLWQLTNLGTRVTAVTRPGENSLAALVQAFEDQLNQTSITYYQNYQRKSLGERGLFGEGKLVQYMFNIPRAWSGNDYRVTTASVSKRLEQLHRAGAFNPAASTGRAGRGGAQDITFTSDAAVQISFSEKTTIVDALTRILESCDKILEAAGSDRRAAGQAMTFKIVTSITSDDSTYLIHFDVYPYPVPIPKRRENNAPNFENHIYYSYTFTGKNSHIEQLKISYDPQSAVALDTKVPLGSWRLAQIAESGQRASDVEKAGTRAVKSIDRFSTIRPNDPIFPNAITLGQQTNFSGQRDTEQYEYDTALELVQRLQEYKSTMAFYHFVSSMDMELTIRGNPNLLRKYVDRATRGGMPNHSIGSSFQPREAAVQDNFAQRVKQLFSAQRAQYQERFYEPRVVASLNGVKNIEAVGPGQDPLLDNNLDVTTFPVFVQLDIGAPEINWDDVDLGELGKISNDSFYPGPYYVLSIKHVFDNGTFTQTMHLIPHPDIPANFSGASANNRKVI